MKLRLVTLSFILMAMLIPIEQVMSQTIEDEFTWQIAFMYVADEYLGGKNGSTTLTIYRDHIRAQYNGLIDEAGNGGASYPNYVIDDLTLQRDQEMNHFDQIISNAKATEQADRKVVTNLIHQVIVEGAAAVNLDSPPNLNTAIIGYSNDVRYSQVQQTTTHVLNGHIANGITDGVAVINAVNPGQYNFNAGLSAHPPGSEAPQAGSGEALPPNIHKPVRFTNHGAVGVTVVVESYIPNPQVQSAPRSDASTVVTPITNSSAYLSLPQGTYTFCYYWELEEDVDNDGYFDYAHKVTGEMSLNQNSPDDVALAPSVGLSPETNSSPNGRCGEGDAISADGLTPQELANQGTFQYILDCADSATYTDSFTFQFIPGGAKITDAIDGKTILFTKASPNVYEATFEGFFVRFTFTDSGFSYGYGEGDYCVATRQ